jgi:hypothetical protein
MPGTKIQSARTPIVVSGEGKYEIVATCIIPGSLPDTGIFLLTITDPAGPKSDILVRVIELGDPAVYVNDRDAAILAKDTQWRSAEVRLQFDDIETANAAQKELSQRINNLVINFDTVNAEFTVVSEIITYPAADATAETAAKNNYIAARTATTAAKVARDLEIVDCNLTETELTTIQTRLSDANSDYLTLSNAQAGLTIANANYPAHKSTINAAVTAAATQVNSSGASSAEKSAITTTLTSIQLELQVMGATNSTLNASTTAVTNSTAALLGVLSSRIATLIGDETTKNLELRQCRAASTKAQGTFDAAQATEAAALANVRVLCPDFDPNSV